MVSFDVMPSITPSPYVIILHPDGARLLGTDTRYTLDARPLRVELSVHPSTPDAVSMRFVDRRAEGVPDLRLPLPMPVDDFERFMRQPQFASATDAQITYAYETMLAWVDADIPAATARTAIASHARVTADVFRSRLAPTQVMGRLRITMTCTNFAVGAISLGFGSSMATRLFEATASHAAYRFMLCLTSAHGIYAWMYACSTVRTAFMERSALRQAARALDRFASHATS